MFTARGVLRSAISATPRVPAFLSKMSHPKCSSNNTRFASTTCVAELDPKQAMHRDQVVQLKKYPTKLLVEDPLDGRNVEGHKVATAAAFGTSTGWNQNSPRCLVGVRNRIRASRPAAASFETVCCRSTALLSSRHCRSNTRTSSATTSTRLYSSSSTLLKDDTTYKVAIVGSGPSGCYTAKYLQLAMNKASLQTEIDILERLPTAYGLVRNGVAPDHPEVKNVQHDFDQLFEKKKEDSAGSSRSPPIQLLANVQVGKDVSLQELRELYDIVVLAFGCESDQKLNIEGSDELQQNILTARQFVNWYNGHPEFDWVGPIVETVLGNNTEKGTQNIVVIGHGNVALDCARILAKTREQLDPTDITTRALQILNPSSSGHEKTKRNVSIVGRRGHVQGAFTIKELRELTKLGDHAQFIVSQQELDAGLATDPSQQELSKSRPKQRINKLLQDNATNVGVGNDETASSSNDDNSTIGTKVKLRFLLNPIRFEAHTQQPDKLGAVVCERTELVGDAGKQQAQGVDGVEETIAADLCLVSIGYKGIPIEGTEPYYDNQRGILQNVHGVVDNARDSDATGLAPLYTSGWLKRGPSGIIGTNIADAKDTVASIMKDIQDDNSMSATREAKESSPSLPLQQLLEDRGVQVVDWKAYLRINDREMSPSHKRNPEQPREKITEWQELLLAAKG